MAAGLSFSTGEVWLGRTRLNSSLTEVRSRLRSSPTISSHLLLERLEDFDATPDQTSDVRPIEAPTGTPWGNSDFPGWVATPPPRPYYTSPCPLNFEHPVGVNECPLPELRPWWDQLVLDGPSTDAPLATLTGSHVRIGPWGMLGWSAGTMASAQSEHGQLDVFNGHVNAWGVTTQTTERISGPGFVGSLVPGYAEARELASSLSQQSAHLSMGCRIDFAYISAITVHLEWNVTAPLLGGKLKELVKRRGYGELTEARLGIELTDGWNPWRVQLRQDAAGTRSEEKDQQALEFALWLIKAVAFHRLETADDAHHGAALAALTSTSPTLTTVADDKKRRSSIRCELPGSRPVSWRSLEPTE